MTAPRHGLTCIRLVLGALVISACSGSPTSTLESGEPFQTFLRTRDGVLYVCVANAVATSDPAQCGARIGSEYYPRIHGEEAEALIAQVGDNAYLQAEVTATRDDGVLTLTSVKNLVVN